MEYPTKNEKVIESCSIERSSGLHHFGAITQELASCFTKMLKKRCVFLRLTLKNRYILADFGWRIEVRFFNIHEKKTHLNSSPKIQKGAFFSWFWKKSFRYINPNNFFLGLYIFTKMTKKKVRFSEMGVSKSVYFGRFWLTNSGAFFQQSCKKCTPILQSKSNKVRFFLLILRKSFFSK